MSKTPPSPNEIIRATFCCLTNLPAWQVTGEFGSWLRFHFGNPWISVTEPHRLWGYKRMAFPEGELQLLVDMCRWVVFQDGEKIANSESRRKAIRSAALALQGQKLHGMTIQTNPPGGEFIFDLGGRLSYQRLTEWEEDHELWSFTFSRKEKLLKIVSFTALGQILSVECEVEPEKRSIYPCEAGRIDVEKGV